jgi:hypothetical protein
MTDTELKSYIVMSDVKSNPFKKHKIIIDMVSSVIHCLPEQKEAIEKICSENDWNALLSIIVLDGNK